MKKQALLLGILLSVNAPVWAEAAATGGIRPVAKGVEVIQILPGYGPQWRGVNSILIGVYGIGHPDTPQTFWRLDPSWQFQQDTTLLPPKAIVSSVTQDGRRAVLTQRGQPATVSLFRFDGTIEAEVLRISEGEYECRWGYQEKEILCAKAAPDATYGTNATVLNFTSLLQSGKAFSLVYDNLLKDKFPLGPSDIFAWDRRTDSERVVFSYWNADEARSYLWIMDLKRKKDDISQNLKQLTKTSLKLLDPAIGPRGESCLLLARQSGKDARQPLTLANLTKENELKTLGSPNSVVLASAWLSDKEILCLGTEGTSGKSGLWRMSLDGKTSWILECNPHSDKDQRHSARVAISPDKSLVAFSLNGLGTAVVRLGQ